METYFNAPKYGLSSLHKASCEVGCNIVFNAPDNKFIVAHRGFVYVKNSIFGKIKTIFPSTVESRISADFVNVFMLTRHPKLPPK